MSVTLSRYADAFVPGLEGLQPGLGAIPGVDMRDPRYLDPDAEWRLKFFDWRKRAAPIRAQVHVACANDARLQAIQRQLCDRDWAYFLNIFGWTYDPRLRENEDPDKPFLLFACQVHKVQEFQRVCADPRKIDIFDTKSRGIGWTDTYVGAAVAAWRSTDWSIHFVSFKEDKVYRRNDRGSIFGKAEYKVQKLPEYLLPRGFFLEDHMLRLNLFNPETGSSITGESTTSKTARGDRKTAIIYDEAAFIEGFEQVYGTGAGTTNHRFVLSTESYEEGDDWERLWQGALKGENPDRVWVLDWWHNPYQDTAWLAEEKARWKNDPTGFAREYLRDAEAAESGWMYPEAKLCKKTPKHYDSTLSLAVGIDPGTADDTAISWGQPITLEDGRKGIRWIGNYKRNKMPVSFYAHLLSGIPPQPGDECWGLWQDDQFSDRDKFLMRWFHDLPGWTRFCMDPAGNQKHSGISFFDLFYKATLNLRVREWEQNGRKGPRPKGIAPLYEALAQMGNLIEDRRNCTRALLGASEFSTHNPDLWRAEEIQESLRRSKFSEGTPRSVSQPKPIHDDYSHDRTTVEFVSTYALFGFIDPPKRQARRMLDALRRAA